MVASLPGAVDVDGTTLGAGTRCEVVVVVVVVVVVATGRSARLGRRTSAHDTDTGDTGRRGGDVAD